MVLSQPGNGLLPQPPQGRLPGTLLSILVHGLLVAALVFSVHWRLREPEAVSAELWSSIPQEAAPRPEPEPQPQPRPAPTPPAPPVPRLAPPPPPPAPAQDAQIAIERARQRALQEKAEEEARAAQLKAEKLAQKLAEKQAALQAKRQAEAQAKQQATQEAKREAAATEKREAAAQKAEAARLEQLRKDQMKRMFSGLTGNGAPDAKGTAAQTSGPSTLSAGYAARLRAAIKPNIVFSDTLSGNPVATVEVSSTATGTIIARRLVKSSGVKAWDEAVVRAIDRTGTLPRDSNGQVPTTLQIDFRPNGD